MLEKSIALEPSFADATAAITTAAELSEEVRRHWRSSLAGVARALDQPPERIPARFSAVRARMASLHHLSLGWTPKTLANHKSNTKAALIWFNKETDALPHGISLTPQWKRLRVQLTDPSSRYRLMPLMRFCSGIQIEPAGVDEAIIDRYLDHRQRTTTRLSDAATRRILARLWNAGIGRLEGWPSFRLLEPPVKAAEGPFWNDLPAGLRDGIDGYLIGLGRVRRNKAGQRIRPCQSSTITMRRRELVAAVRMAVSIGVPLADLNSMSALVHPDVASQIIDAYWKKDGELPKTYTINLAWRFVAIAHATGCLSEEALHALEDLRFQVEQHREEGMTAKNLALIRSVLTEGVWSRVVDLPELLMQEARRERHAPVKAAVLAQIAVAVAILSVAPIRLANLASIRLGEHLTKPGGPESGYWLSFAKYEVKNKRSLQFKLDGTVTALINEYVHDFRPALVRGSNADWLFPGQAGDHKEKISFSTQIVDRIEKSTGLRITAHQFRHAAGALILRHHPGNYELVRQFLGHASVETTTRFYLALETTHASEIYTDIVRNKLKFTNEDN